MLAEKEHKKLAVKFEPEEKKEELLRGLGIPEFNQEEEDKISAEILKWQDDFDLEKRKILEANLKKREQNKFLKMKVASTLQDQAKLRKPVTKKQKVRRALFSFFVLLKLWHSAQ